MEMKLDQSLYDLGIEKIVIAIVRGVDTGAELPDAFLKELEEAEAKAVAMDDEILNENPVIQGYKELVSKVGRSVKKNLPTASALFSNVKRRGSLPRINSVVDIYNVETLRSYLAIGAHDLDKIKFPIEFTVSGREDVFLPIGSTEKKVADYDFLYRDQKGVLAYLDCRDSELYKIEDETKNVLFVVQGNAYTSAEYRIEALERVCKNLQRAMAGLEYEIQVITR